MKDRNISLRTLQLVLGEKADGRSNGTAREYAWKCGCHAAEDSRGNCNIEWCTEHARTLALNNS